MNFQIQNIKVQLKTIENNLDNISMMINMNNVNIKSQLENIGIQMLNLGIEIFNNSLSFIGIMNTFDSTKQLTNISLQIQNLINRLNNNMAMPTIPMNNNLNIPIMPQIPVMQINNNFNNFQQNNNNNKNFDIKKLNIIFESTKGTKILLPLDIKTTVGEMLKAYLLRIEKPELINTYDKITFIHNRVRIRFDFQTTIEEYFRGEGPNPKIIVNDIKDIIGG